MKAARSISATPQVPLAALAMALAALATACSQPGGSSVRILPQPKHVILVTIDTLRADHVSAFGYPIETTPWFDAMAAQGVLFTRAYSQSATTKPSHTSLFTSLYPMQHGVQNNTLVLDDSFRTMAEMFADLGFRTAAFISADAPLGGNVGQGFQVWNQPGQQDRKAKGSKGKLYRPAAATVDQAIEWLRVEGAAAKRLFLWVHVYDPHRPLEPPPEHLVAVRAQAESAGHATLVNVLTDQGIPAQNPSSYEKVLEYDAEIHYADAELARLQRALEVFGIDKDALWVVASDHGQGLGAHGWFGHSVQIYNAQLHVPLLFRFPGQDLPARRIDDRVVELVDVLPTLAGLLGGDVSQQVGSIRGRSLVADLLGRRPRDAKWFAYAERSRYVNASPHRQGKGNYEPGFRYAYQDLDYKYVLFTEGHDEFYDLRDDPNEKIDRIDDPAYRDTREQMKSLLTELVAGLDTHGGTQKVSPAEIERLRALGYIQ